MIQTRFGVFETNSSSTHTLCIMPAETYEKVCSGELFIEDYGKEVYTREEAINKAVERNNRYCSKKYTREEVASMEEEDLLAFLKDMDIVQFDDWGSDYLEFFEEKYTTPSGDKIVVFGQYGYDA